LGMGLAAPLGLVVGLVVTDRGHPGQLDTGVSPQQVNTPLNTSTTAQAKDVFIVCDS
jgi:hypothetical protein